MATKDTQDWLEAYLELCTLIKATIPEIEHIDLWYDQLSYELQEYPYPPKSLFIDFNATSIDTIGIKAQDMNFNVGFIFAFDTVSDSFDDSPNQAIALEFGTTLRKIHSMIHGLSGDNFSSMNRNGFGKENAPQHCIAYRQTYACIIRDYGAIDDTEETDLGAIPVTLQITKGAGTPPEDLEMFPGIPNT